MATLGEQLKEVGFEIELYKSFYDQCKEIINSPAQQKIGMIKSQIKLTERLWNNFKERQKENL